MKNNIKTAKEDADSYLENYRIEQFKKSEVLRG